MHTVSDLNVISSLVGTKYPNITVELTRNCDSNAFAIMGTVVKALREANLPFSEIQLFRQEAMSGDYDHLLRTCTKWVNVA